MLRGIQVGAQNGKLLVEGFRAAVRGMVSLPGNAAETIQNLAKLVVPELKRRGRKEEHTLENASKLSAEFTGVLFSFLTLEE
jgi:hypothetical protein